ncbi:UbiD family decarboxylase [Streptomyces sp. RB110-1]|nr:UbiD family decarboxylase [Streptomyces sp. RB110-1]MBK0373126.1 UbiD family decarboxylase [Streptomyces sp. RB110-1]MBK0390506.1 UbiD family decarboxylase [Streptomyces sp. RB110-2]
MSHPDPSLDFRAFLDGLLAAGDAVAIEQTVDPHLEVGAITRRAYETHAQAPLFTSLTGAEPGFRILGAPAGLSSLPGERHGRIAAHFGLARTSTPREILEHLVRAMHAEPVPPVVVPSGPSQQNVAVGDAVDLERLPVPLLHQEDGGRYLGTYGFHVVQSPDGTWTSWSVARTMLHDRRTLVGPAMPQQHIGMIRQMWSERGEHTPWAMVLGAPPAALAAAAMPLPEQVNEDGYVGALTGRPVEVVRTLTNGLHVPANAEIVLEGYLSSDESAPEGPMGEYHGYAFSEGKHQPVFHVEAVTWRDAPVLPVCVAGLPPEENHTVWGTMISASALDLLRTAGLPVDLAWCSYEAATCWIVLSIDRARRAALGWTRRQLVDAVAEVLFPSHVGWMVPKVILVDDDIDITDVNQVVWALATRNHPATGQYVFPDAPGIPMVPYLTPEEVRTATGGKSVTDCLLPEDFRGTTASFRGSYPQRLQEQVLADWHRYGY